jgi:phage gpG-like protein
VISANLLGEAPALERLRGMRDAANQGIARAIGKLGIDLQNNIQQNKLSGQVLHVRSGSLRQSIAVQIDASDTAVGATVSSDLDYASAHEYGFTGVVNVRANLRLIKEAFGHPIDAKTIGVSAHSRRMNLPERSFLRSALYDMTPHIGKGIEDALREALIR